MLRGRNFQPGEKGVAMISKAMEMVVWLELLEPLYKTNISGSFLQVETGT